MSEEQFDVDPRQAGHRGLDGMLSALVNNGFDLGELQAPINAIRQAITTPDNEAGHAIDQLVGLLGAKGYDLNLLDVTSIRRAIKEKKQ